MWAGVFDGMQASRFGDRRVVGLFAGFVCWVVVVWAFTDWFGWFRFVLG